MFNVEFTGTADLNGTIATTGNQSYGGDVELLGDTTLTSGAGAIDIGTSGGVVGTNGIEKLTLGDASQTGTVTLGGGSSVTLGDLDIGAGAFDVVIDTPYTVNVNSAVDFLNSGNLSITTGAGQSSYVKFRDGLNATAVSQLNFFGAVRTENAPIDVSDVVITNPNNYSYPLGAFFTAESGSEPGGSVTLQSLDTGGGAVGYTTGVTGQFILSQDSTITGYGIQGTGDFKALGNITVGEVGNTTTAINTTGDQNYASDVTLTGNANFTGNTTATFTNGVEGAGNDLTLNFTQAATVDGFANVADFTSEGAVDLNGTFTTTGFQNGGNVSLSGDTELVATTVEFSDGLTGNSHNLTLSPSSSSIKLAGINLSGVNELAIGGDLELAGDLTAQNIDIQGETTLLGDANLTATGTASGDWSTASLANTVTTSGYATKLALSPDGRHAYIADDNAGMQVVDLQHPSGPAIVGNFNSGVGSAFDVVANATHAFVSHFMGDLHIVDVSNPSPHSQLVTYRFLIWGLRLGGLRMGCRCMVMLFMLLMETLGSTMLMCQTQRTPRCQRPLAQGLHSLV